MSITERQDADAPETPVITPSEQGESYQSADFGQGSPEPAPAYSSPDQVNTVVGQGPQQQGQPQQPPQKGGLWRRVLAGALEGLSGGGIPGAITGALHPNEMQQVKDARMANRALDVRMKDAQTANYLAQAARLDQEIMREPEELQRARDEHGQKLVAFARSLGQDFDVIPNSGDAASGYMAQAMANDPQGVGLTGRPIITPSFIYIPKPSDAATQYNVLSKVAPLFGYSLPDKGTFLASTPQARAKTLSGIESMLSGHAQNGDPLTGDKLRNQLALAKAGLAAYKNKPEYDPMVEQAAQDRIDLLETAVKTQNDSDYKNKVQYPTQVAEQRAKAMQSWKNVAVLDKDNNLVNVPAWRAWDEGLAPAASGQKAMSAAVQMQEIKVASQNLRQAIGALGNEPFDTATVGKISAALHGVPENAKFADIRRAIQSQLADHQLTEQQKNFIVWTSQAYERAMSLRSVQGIGQSGSDKLRDAIIKMLPTESDTPDMMKRKLNAFDNTVSILERAIPGSGRGGQNTKNATQPTTPAPTPQNTGGGPKQKFSIKKWAAANPQGDLAAARAAATKAGMEVIP